MDEIVGAGVLGGSVGVEPKVATPAGGGWG